MARRWGPGTQLDVRDTPEGVLLSPKGPTNKVALTTGLASIRRQMACQGPAVSLTQMNAAVLREAALLAPVPAPPLKAGATRKPAR